QAAILGLLEELQATEGVAYILISHDLAVVRYLAGRIGVMYMAQLVEIGDTEAIFAGPKHPYTEALLSAIPTIDGDDARPRIRLAARRSRPDRLRSFFLPGVVAPGLRAVTTRPHVAPAPAAVVAGIHEEPVTALPGAAPHPERLSRHEQLRRRSHDRPDHPVQ